MKQPIHYCKVKHRTCQTLSGRRRSPVYGPSYDADMELLDAVSGRTIYRPHRDGTYVIYSDIFSADADCRYTDKSVSLQERRAALWNDLYAENKTNKERIAAYGEIAIPNDISDEEMIALTKRLGEYFATTYKRPCDLSIHKKPGNNHVHFSLPEREYKRGKWLAKRKKFYKDMNGNIIRDKNYYDERGWDIRKPKIDKKRVPKGADPYARNPETGDYLYQKLGDRNRKQWEDDTREGKFLEPEELTALHNNVDDIVNGFLHEQGYGVTVKRNRPEVTKLVRDLGIGQIRIPTQDYKTNSSVVEEIRQKNDRNRMLQQALEDIIDKSDLAEINLYIAEDEKMKADALADLYKEERQVEQRNLSQAEMEYQTALKKYVENELHPEDIYVTDCMQSYQEALHFKEQQCTAAETILIAGAAATDREIEILEKQAELSERENNKLEFYRKNKASYEFAVKEVSRIRKINKSEEMRTFHQNTWRGLSGWKRANYIYRNVSKDAGILYRDYLLYNGEIKHENNLNVSLPAKVTFESALSSVIKGKAVPGIKSQLDRSLTAMQNAQNAAATSLECWKNNANADLHLPPIFSDFEFLTLAYTVPERVRELYTNPDNLHFYPVRLDNYNPEKDRQLFQSEDERLANIEAKQKAWNFNKLDALQKVENNKFNILLATVKAAAYEYDLGYATQEWERFKKAEKPYTTAQKAYEDFKEAEYAEQAKYENKVFSFYEYIPDQRKIARLKQIADNELNMLKQRYPDYPAGCPKEPNPYQIKYEIDVEHKDILPDKLIKAAQEMKIDNRLIIEYKVAATAVSEYLNDKPPGLKRPDKENMLGYQKQRKSNDNTIKR